MMLLPPEAASFKINYEVTASPADAGFSQNPISKGGVARDECVFDAMGGKRLHCEEVRGAEA